MFISTIFPYRGPGSIPLLVDIEKTFDNRSKEENDPLSSKQTRVVGEKKRILVAEDIESNFRLINAILNKGYELVWVSTGTEAVERARTEYFDAILMDIQMPLMDGLEATRLIRTFNHDIPIVALTAYTYDSDYSAALAAGCNTFIAKPINRKMLQTVLDEWI